MAAQNKRNTAPPGEQLSALGHTPSARPRSAGHFGLNLLGLLGGAMTILAMVHWPLNLDPKLAALPWHLNRLITEKLVIALSSCVVVILIIGSGELFWWRSYKKPSTGLAAKPLRKADWQRIAVRLVGFYATLGCVAIAYMLFREYHGDFYYPFWGLLVTLAGPLLLLGPFYFAWTDTHLLDPRDSYWHLGMVVLGRGTQADRKMLPQHFMGWTVKCFFLPLMIHYLVDNMGGMESVLSNLLSSVHVLGGLGDGMSWYHFLFQLSYTVDLLFCVVGYTVTLRVFDSHIRSTEPTTFGWVIAIACYMPFYRVVGDFYLNYANDVLYWDVAVWPWLRGIWGAAIICLVLIFCLSTVSFGLRFSNLTYRGIITNGTYRICKHPAYLSKNLSWWLISMPWLVHQHWYQGAINCGALTLLNLVYYLRARTEENHLSRDPDYVAYALWMDQYGPLRFLGRLFPILCYRPPTKVPAEAMPPGPASGAALVGSR